MKILKFILLPSLVYFTIFVIFTYPAIWSFSTHLYTDTGDGFMHYWNLWWVKKAVTELYQTIWHTDYLHFPYGTSLYGHSLNPFGGFIAILMSPFLNLFQVHNILVIFSFVAGGLFAFLLSYQTTRSIAGSLVGGFIYSFSNYHFAHMDGHLELVSIQFIPLFLLIFVSMIEKPKIYKGIFSAIILFLTLLCSYYYFFYCLFGAIIIFLYYFFSGKASFILSKKFILEAFLFLVIFVITSGPLIISLLEETKSDVLIGGHIASHYSMDLLIPFIPGGHWRFNSLTKFYWQNLNIGNIAEESISLGISAFLMAFFVFLVRKKTSIKNINLWFIFLIVFLVLSLGPVIYVKKTQIYSFFMPYTLLEILFPPFKNSGMPVRMILMTGLGLGVVCAAGIKYLMEKRLRKRFLIGLFLTLLLFEYLPKPIKMSQPVIPSYIVILKNLPGEGFIDTVSSESYKEFYQTLHEKKMAFGYLARLPGKVIDKDLKLYSLIYDRNYSVLCRNYHFKYILLISGEDKGNSNIKLVNDDGFVALYEIMPGDSC